VLPESIGTGTAATTMEPWLAPYAPTIVALGAMAALLLLQLLVADVAGIAAGHVPGTPVEARHDLFLFRANRAHANTNETIAAFILLSVFGIFAGASPSWQNGLAWTFVLARASHMLCYYGDLRLLRSASFGIAVIALVGMLVIGFSALA
jgi:uncharacterized MAPEG superfamily protein